MLIVVLDINLFLGCKSAKIKFLTLSMYDKNRIEQKNENEPLGEKQFKIF